MTDHETLIKNLEYHRANPTIAGVERYGEMIVQLPVMLVDNVIDTLKGQEPRVMSFDDIAHNDYAVVETHGWYEDFCEPSKLIHYSDFEDYITTFVDFEGCEFDCANKEYGITWRCWTTYPTLEQRKAVPWNDA